MGYPGGKSGDGVYQTIINQMPPHEIYVEPFLGGGAIMRAKRPAPLNIGLDLSPQAITGFTEPTKDRSVIFKIKRGDALDYLSAQLIEGVPSMLIYCDPPYLKVSRRSGDLYDFEMDRKQHERFLWIVTKLKCMVMVSGYNSVLYNHELRNWRKVEFQAMTRSGPATEVLWLNYPQPVELHDYSYIGDGYRERERIKKKKTRWVAKLKKMPTLERQALLAAIREA